jgi:hypothetical protein
MRAMLLEAMPGGMPGSMQGGSSNRAMLASGGMSNTSLSGGSTMQGSRLPLMTSTSLLQGIPSPPPPTPEQQQQMLQFMQTRGILASGGAGSGAQNASNTATFQPVFGITAGTTMLDPRTQQALHAQQHQQQPVYAQQQLYQQQQQQYLQAQQQQQTPLQQPQSSTQQPNFAWPPPPPPPPPGAQGTTQATSGTGGALTQAQLTALMPNFGQYTAQQLQQLHADQQQGKK